MVQAGEHAPHGKVFGLRFAAKEAASGVREDGHDLTKGDVVHLSPELCITRDLVVDLDVDALPELLGSDTEILVGVCDGESGVEDDLDAAGDAEASVAGWSSKGVGDEHPNNALTNQVQSTLARAEAKVETREAEEVGMRGPVDLVGGIAAAGVARSLRHGAFGCRKLDRK